MDTRKYMVLHQTGPWLIGPLASGLRCGTPHSVLPVSELSFRHIGFADRAVEYVAAWELQREVHAGVMAGGPDTVLLLEHLPVFTAVYAVSGVAYFSGGVLPLLAVGLPISLALAWLSHVVVERPAMRWAARRVPHRRAPLPR